MDAAGIVPKFDIKELREGLYRIDDSGVSKCFLIVGTEKACVIDTANGFNDLAKAVRELTDKPIIIINTHGHPDHMMGNYSFDHALMNSKDWPLAKTFIDDPRVVATLEANGWRFPEFTNIEEGEVIDLGGRTLEVYAIPGHTLGSIMLLCPEERILFTGDSINHHLYLQLDGCLSVEESLEVLESKSWIMEKADYILHGHGDAYDDISLITYLKAAMKEIIDGKTDADESVEWDAGQFGMCHKFRVPEDKTFNCIDSLVMYQKDNITK